LLWLDQPKHYQQFAADLDHPLLLYDRNIELTEPE
jgi:hypothetical protein